MNKKWRELILYVPYENEEKTSLIMEDMAYNTFELVDPRTRIEDSDLETWLYFDESIFEGAYQGLTYKLYSQEDDFQDLVESLAGLVDYQINTIDQADWENNWKDFYHTMPIGKSLVIVPDWEDYDNVEDRHVIRLSPGMAFGTGGHESTELALVNLEKYLRPGHRILDVGTGSGILAIGAGLLGAGQVVATDIDPSCIQIARTNAEKNNLHISLYQSNLLEDVQGTYDIVIANIVAEIIDLMLADLARVLDKDGYFIVSGILLSKKDQLVQGFQDHGLKLVDWEVKNDWVSLVGRFDNV